MPTILNLKPNPMKDNIDYSVAWKADLFNKLKYLAEVVEAENGLKKGGLKVKRNGAKYVNARKMFWKASIDDPEIYGKGGTLLTIAEIASYTGHDHSTVIYGAEKCEEHIDSERWFSDTYNRILEDLGRYEPKFPVVEMFP